MFPELEFLKSLWGLGTKEEEGYRTGPQGYIGWRNSFLGVDSGAPYTFKNTGSAVIPSETLTRNTSPGTGGARVVCPVVEDCVVVTVVVRVEVVEGMVEVGAGAEDVLGRHTPPVQDKPAQHWVILAKIKVFKKMLVVFRSHYVTVLNSIDTHSTK